MKRFFDYPPDVLAYFAQVEQAYGRPRNLWPTPPRVPSFNRLKSVRAVLWDVYGTLCGLDSGDLDQTLVQAEKLRPAAAVVIEAFGLATSLVRLYPESEPDQALVKRYLVEIDASHQRSRERDILYPEVRIEKIWETILQSCESAGWNRPVDELPAHAALRIGYLFDHGLQRMDLYPGMATCLFAVKQAGLYQGIISNAQFYTPLRLRRLLRAACGNNAFELEEVFDESLVFFSYELGYSKPNPNAFEMAVKHLQQQGMGREEIVFIGNDMFNDIAAARASGLQAMLCAVDREQTNFRPGEPACAGVEPNAIAQNAEQMQQFLLGT